jgi:CheY-like chemotaxis protein
MKSFKNILIAEDDDDDYQFLAEALEQINSGFTVKKATNGLQVMGYLNSLERPDIVFLDLNMPIKNGIATLQLIKAIPEFSAIPVVIYSTSNHHKAIDEAYKNEAHFYMVKPDAIPVIVEQLLFVFNRLLTDESRPLKQDFVISVRNQV